MAALARPESRFLFNIDPGPLDQVKARYERLRERGNTVPVIMMSGYAADGDEAATPPGVPLIEKPWTVEALAHQVGAVLGTRRTP